MRNVFTVTLAGESLGTFDERELTLNDAFTLEYTTGGMTFDELLDGGKKGKPAALRALIWFMRFKQGKPVDLLTIDYKLVDLVTEAVKDPTPAKGSRSRAATAKNATAS